MSKIIRKKPNYLLIGFFMFIGILGIMVSVIFSDKLITKLRGGYPIYIKFNDIDGLVTGSKVTVRGGKHIGQVDSIEINGPVLVIKALIDKKYKINQDAQFCIYSTSLVGGRYLAVENYTGEAPYINKNAELEGISPISMNKIFSMIGDIFTSGIDDSMKSSVGGFFSSLNATGDLLHKIIKDNKNNIDEIIVHINESSKHLNSLSSNLDRKLNMINDQEFKKIITDIESSIYNLDIFLKDINSPNAPLFLLKDPNITQSLRAIITNLQETTERVKAKPSLLFRS